MVTGRPDRPKHAQDLQQQQHRPTPADAPAARWHAVHPAVAVMPQGLDADALRLISIVLLTVESAVPYLAPFHKSLHVYSICMVS